MKKLAFTSIIERFLSFLKRNDLLLELTWDELMSINAPFPETKYSIREVIARYSRNGYDWDIHGTLYFPEKEAISGNAIVMVHGGGVNELTFNRTPHGLGWAHILASQGFKILTISYPGLWPPNGSWPTNPQERTPIFLLDREIASAELKDRILKYTFNLVVQGIATLVNQNLCGNNILVFGHSIGARLVIDLGKFPNIKIVGILGFASLGAKIWEDELQEKVLQRKTEGKPKAEKPTLEKLTQFRRILPNTHEPRILLPLLRTHAELEECVRLSGLQREEYFDNSLTKEPEAKWLINKKVLLVIGENDDVAPSHNWPKDQLLDVRPAYYIAQKFSHITRATHLVIVPRYGHTGHLELNSEKITYLWLWAIKSNYF
ncbi:MAG: alpha/beta hydrolase [Candidatus Bathyarchaeota archaeon]